MADFDLTQSGQEIQNILDGAAMQTDLTAEIERAGQAEQQLQDDIDIEETRAKAAEKQNADDIDVIEGKIPAAASSENQLADKAFVNSSIATATATYRGAYNLVSDLHLTIDATEQQIAAALAGDISTADNNDYCFVQVPTADATPTQIAAIERYKFNGTAWAYEYTLNNSGFTADQWAALNSGITTGLVAKLAALPTNDELTLLLGGKQDVLTFDNVPTEGSNNPVKSGGVKSAIDSEKERAQGAEQANAGNIAQVIAMIPAAASSENQLADKNFVNSSIATNTATYRGAYNEVSDLSLTVDATHEQIAAALAGAISTADNNDYCFVQIPTADAAPTQIAAIERYKFNGTDWAYEYTLNNSGFTADQWAALNSGITTGLVAKLAALPTNDDLVAALAGKQPMLTFDNVPTESSTNPVKSGGVYAAIAEEAGTRAAAIAAIVALIPSTASALNQLADKAFVDSSISTATAVFKGTFNVVADLELNYNASQAQIALMLGSKIASADNNDYCFVQIPNSNETPLEIARTDRYKFNGTAWAYEYTLNNSGFTAAQWAAINSGITSLLKDKLIDLPTATELATQLAAKQNALTFDTTPTEGSTNPVTSDGIHAAINVEKERAEAAEESLDINKADKATTLAGYGITDAYNKTEVNNMITTPNQNYVTVATYASLPASGSANTIYRVSSYDGANSQVDDTVYSEYAWNGTQYVFLCVKSQIEEVFDITVYNSNTKYADLAAALGVDGANIPATLRRGGMSIKYVQSSDNKYVQYRLVSDSFNTNTSNWIAQNSFLAILSKSEIFNSIFKEFYIENPDFDYAQVTSMYIDKADNRGGGVYRDTICLKSGNTDVIHWYKNFNSIDAAIDYFSDIKVYELISTDSIIYALIDFSTLPQGRTTFNVQLTNAIITLNDNPCIEHYIKNNTPPEVDTIATPNSMQLVTSGGVTNFASKSFISNTGLFNSVFKEFYIKDCAFDVTQITSMWIDKADDRGGGNYRTGITLKIGDTEVFKWHKDKTSVADALQVFSNRQINEISNEVGNETLYVLFDWDSLSNGRTQFDVSILNGVLSLDLNPSIKNFKITPKALRTLTVASNNVHDFDHERPGNPVQADLLLWKDLLSGWLNADFLTINEWTPYFDNQETIDTYNTLLKQFYPYYSSYGDKGLFSKYPCTFHTQPLGRRQLVAEVNLQGKSLAVICWDHSNIVPVEERVEAYNAAITYLQDFDYAIISGDFNNDAGPEELAVFTQAGYILGNNGYWGQIDTCTTSTNPDFAAIDNIVTKGFVFDLFEKSNNAIRTDHFPVRAKLQYYE